MRKFGAGRPAAHPEVYEISPLSALDIKNFVPAETSQQKGIIQKLRDSHHRIAHLYALGFRPGEIAEITGYSLTRLSTLRANPAFTELVEKYRVEVVATRQGETDEHFKQIVRLRNLAVGELIDRFEDDESREKIANSHLIALAADGSDRTGYPKRRESVNINGDFASRLDRAIERANSAKIIEGEVINPSSANPNTNEFKPDGGGLGETAENLPVQSHPVPYRRRA